MPYDKLSEFKRDVQSIFDNTLDDPNDERFFDTSKSLKAYLVENNNPFIPIVNGYSEWKQFSDVKSWYYATDNNKPDQCLVYDNSLGRVGILYTILKVGNIDKTLLKWIRLTPYLDNCWLSKKQILSCNAFGWTEIGIGLKYRNILNKSRNSDAPTLSLKAWYGSGNEEKWTDIIEPLKKMSSISSIRWRKNDGNLVSEWYNNGKITVSSADSVDEVMMVIFNVAKRYYEELERATKLRDNNLCSFELDFSKSVDIDSFSKYVQEGRSALKLWMIETESSHDFKRFRGVDLHTWDPIYIDMTSKYAYLTIPIGGCVNAAPRISVIQGQNTTGDTTITFNGDDIFV